MAAPTSNSELPVRSFASSAQWEAWLAAQPQVSSVISGATSPEQVSQNVKAGTWKLSADELAEVDKLTRR